MDHDVIGQAVRAAIEQSGQGNQWPMIFLAIVISVLGAAWAVDKAWFHRERIRGKKNGATSCPCALLSESQRKLISLAENHEAQISEAREVLGEIDTQGKINGDRLLQIAQRLP